MAFQVTTPINRFSIGNSVPYFQQPIRSPPSRFDNYGGGILTGGGTGSPLHGNGGPWRKGSKTLRRGDEPLSRRPLSGNGCPSGGRPPKGGGSKFLIGGTSVLFSVA